MNDTNVECYVSDEDVELAKTIAMYIGIVVISTCGCVIGRLCCIKKLCCC